LRQDDSDIKQKAPKNLMKPVDCAHSSDTDMTPEIPFSWPFLSFGYNAQEAKRMPSALPLRLRGASMVKR
jgi:hypothetical protein